MAEYTTIDEYIATFSPEIQVLLTNIRNIVKEVVPEATEKISYQMPTFYLNGNLVHFAAFKKHIGFYPTPSGIEAFQNELSGYKGAKGSIQFPLNQPIPYDLIRRIVLYRLEENQNRNNEIQGKTKDAIKLYNCKQLMYSSIASHFLHFKLNYRITLSPPM